MGVHGLWKLLEPVGKVVPLEGMAGKVLAVDVSIWLHQAIKGMHDSRGAPIAVAHLLILFRRLCKLLFYKIKPVFVFDGGVPALKRETMSARRKFRSAAKSEAMKVRGKLLKNLLKHEAVRQMLSHGQPSEILGLSSLALPGSSVEEELYRLPPVAEEFSREKSDGEEAEEEISSDDGDAKFAEDIHSIDVTSSDFKSLPPDVRHEILLELIETRKQSSWKNLDKMPKDSDNFSDFQMSRLLKRRAVQASLDEAGKEMGGRSMSLKELEQLLVNRDPNVDYGDEYYDNALPGKRIAQNDLTRYVLAHKDDEPKQPEPEESVEEGLTQSEIYDIIKKENATAGDAKPVTLTAETRIKLTDDVKEILPFLNTANIKIESADDSGDVSNPKKEPPEEEEVPAEEPAEGSSHVSNPKEEPTEDGNDVTNLEKEPAAEEMPAEEPTEDGNDVANLEKEPAAEELPAGGSMGPNPSPESRTTSESQVQEEAMKMAAAKCVEEDLSSEESETEFVDVPSPAESGPERRGMELVVDTAKNAADDAEDIFADVFATVAEPAVPGEESPSSAQAPEVETLTETDLQDLKKSVESECYDLMQEHGRQERVAQSISEQMSVDAQELLRLFGVPYVVAPMEAEAQCAVLNAIGLTDGTITDDSDIWLFGGRVVYRNFFNQKKHVLEYKSQDIEASFKLTREDMIKLALLVGSDYTSGLEGIGPVTALEILGAFRGSKDEDTLSGLKRFREWVSGGGGGCDHGPGTRALRRKLKATKMIPGFPSEAVVEAYMRPQTDDSREPFSWAKPNVALLEKYAKAKFGWTREKCAELLTPVAKKMAETKRDATLDKYFCSVSKDAPLRGSLSKRVENAVMRLKSERSNAVSADADESEPERKRPRKRSDGKKVAEGRGRNAATPQKLALERMLEERKRNAIKIFKDGARKGGKRKSKAVAAKEVDLSESSSDDN